MRFLTTHSRQAAVWATIGLLVALPILVTLIPDNNVQAVDSRAAKGVISKVPETRAKNLRGVDWRPGTDQAFIVGQGAVYLYNAANNTLTQLDGTESTDHYYESIAWRPQGDYAIIVGATPASSKAKGLISKIWFDGSNWKISALSTSISVRLTGIDWSPDGTYAIIVGGARHGEAEAVGAIMLRLSGSSGLWTEIYSDAGPAGLSDVAFNPALEKFYACGLDGKMVIYDGVNYTLKNDASIKNADLFSITWRDNGGRGIMGGWYSGTLKHFIVSTDGTYSRIIHEDSKYVNNANWAPGSDYTLLVGQSGSLWEYSQKDGLVSVDNTIDSKYYYGVKFKDDGKVAVVVGGDGSILRYDVNYPAQLNYPPYVVIVSPHEDDVFDHSKAISFSSNSTHDDDLDKLDYTWTSSIDGTLSTLPYFTTTKLTAGNQNITLSVDDNNGHVTKTSINITIKPPTDPPIIDAGSSKIAYVGVDVTLDGKIVKSDYDIKFYEWDCQGIGDFRTTTEASYKCRYGAVGRYNATLRVTDIRLAVATDTARVTVFPKTTSADDLVDVATPGPLRKGDMLRLYLNGSQSTSLKLYVVNEKGTELPLGSKHLLNDTYYVDNPIPRDFKNGKYDIKWRYVDENNSQSEFYVSKDRFTVRNVKGPSVDWLRYAAAALLITIIVIVIVIVIMFMLKRSISKIESTVLFYRDGRVMCSHAPSPPTVNGKQGPAQPPTSAPTSPAPVQSPAAAAPPIGQSGMQYPAQQYGEQYPSAASQYPGYSPPTAQPQADPNAPYLLPPPTPVASPQTVTAQPASPPTPAEPESITMVKTCIQVQIDGIRQGTVSKIPDKAVIDHRTIFIEQGQHTILAVSVSGPEVAALRKKMKHALQEIEILYGNQLRNWDGLTTDMPKLQSLIEKNVNLNE